MMTPRQKQALDVIERHNREGSSPTMAELSAALGLRSKSASKRLIDALVERGFVRRIPHLARSLEVVRRPTPAPQKEPVGWLVEKRSLLAIIQRQNERLAALGQPTELMP